MAITKAALAILIEQAYDVQSNNPDITPSEARKQIAEDIADAIELYVVSRTTVVTGSSVSGGAVTAIGVIE
ncbi:MAG: hypothetical protein COB73_00730 [Flavobacteriaceae bacterium]|nr:MAG: hypothetical protein COB73_00730 [Flavobacteriaceae bacterium]